MPFSFTPTKDLPDVVLVEPKVFGDARGHFFEAHKKSDFEAHGLPGSFVMSAISHSTGAGLLRGLHYQKAPHAQGKLVRALAGEIFDVAVDLRKGAPTFGRWTGARLSAQNKRALWLPPGFAHGFCSLSEEATVLYEMTAEYAPTHERVIRWNDPAIGIAWPVATPRLADRDANAPLLKDADL